MVSGPTATGLPPFSGTHVRSSGSALCRPVLLVPFISSGFGLNLLPAARLFSSFRCFAFWPLHPSSRHFSDDPSVIPSFFPALLSAFFSGSIGPLICQLPPIGALFGWGAAFALPFQIAAAGPWSCLFCTPDVDGPTPPFPANPSRLSTKGNHLLGRCALYPSSAAHNGFRYGCVSPPAFPFCVRCLSLDPSLRKRCGTISSPILERLHPSSTPGTGLLHYSRAHWDANGASYDLRMY